MMPQLRSPPATQRPHRRIWYLGWIEITACRVVVPAGQMLFHGRVDRELDELAPCPSFVSTPLDPTASIYHAIKRQQQRTGARTILYALTLESPLPALWSNGGSLEEWELLCSPD